RLAQAETVVGENRFAVERAVTKFRDAFRAYGLPPGAAEPGAAAERIRQRPPAVREAIACYQGVIKLEPTYAKAHCNLGRELKRQGRFAEALAAYRRGHELGTKQPGWGYPSEDWVRKAERMAAVGGKFPAFLKGEFKPEHTAERLGLAEVCHVKKYHRA